jgi:hypothetical protein
MIQTFKDLQDSVMRVLDETATNSPTTLVLVKDFLNQSHTRRCTEFPWNFMVWPKEITFTTSVGRQTYGLHEEFHRPLYFRNLTTGEYLQEIPNRSVIAEGGNWQDTTVTSSVVRYMPWGMQPIQQQPTTTSIVIVGSSSASDTSSKTVTITGQLASGILTSETLSMNGTTNVNGSVQFQEITEITKSGPFVGTLTVFVGGTSVLSLGPNEYGKQFKTIFIPDTIGSAESIGYRFYRQPRKLVNDYDIPLIPAPHAQILAYDTLVQMAAYMTESGPQTLKIWQEKAAAEQMALYQAYANESTSLGGGTQYIHWGGGDDHFPTVYR